MKDCTTLQVLLYFAGLLTPLVLGTAIWVVATFVKRARHS